MTSAGEQYFERALTVAREQQVKSRELRAAMRMARLWRDQGKRDEARDWLAPRVSFDTLDLKEAKALLDELAREDSTGGKQKLRPISKRGDRYLRRILVVGACAVSRYARQKPEKYPWLTQLLARKPFKVVAVALAEQDGPHRLGVAGQGRHLSRACACGSGVRSLAMGG